MKYLQDFLILAILAIIHTGDTNELQWDELKFTQEWGHSACKEFKDRSKSEVKCRFEEKPSIWSVHGIWPTKRGSEGPNFCSKVTFDVQLLSPIMDDLQQFWYEIDETKIANHFWEHEWLKHGSCAKELDTFATELKYFSKGLDLRSKLDLYTILKTGGGIVPQAQNSKGYLLEDIHNAFKKALGSESTVPYVQCLKTKGEANEEKYYLLAVEICLDKDLKVTDCSSRDSLELIQDRYGDNAGPCSKTAPIFYEDNFPSKSKSEEL